MMAEQYDYCGVYKKSGPEITKTSIERADYKKCHLKISTLARCDIIEMDSIEHADYKMVI